MTGRGKLSDAELSKKLGHYQKMSRVWILVGLFGALSGTVSYFAVQDTALKAILTGVLFFGGICCAVFLGGSAQKKLQALIQEQFGDFFVRNGKRPSARICTHRKCALTSRFSGRSTCWTVSGRNVRLRISMRAIIAACIFPLPMCG